REHSTARSIFPKAISIETNVSKIRIRLSLSSGSLEIATLADINLYASNVFPRRNIKRPKLSCAFAIAHLLPDLHATSTHSPNKIHAESTFRCRYMTHPKLLSTR